MSGWRISGVFGLGAVLLVWPGILKAQVYTIHIPQAAVTSRFELSVAYPVGGGGVKSRMVSSVGGTATAGAGDWEVTVGLDAVRCEITCVYRRLRESTQLLPPLAEIKLDGEFRSAPATIVVDPAGLRFPTAASRAAVSEDLAFLPGQEFFVAAPVPTEDVGTAAQELTLLRIDCPLVAVPAALPLRI
ncbi:MAG TPA: hypothetical protein VGH38_18920 [Bryobacteraceae bacterium]